jgi:hypothetical protein
MYSGAMMRRRCGKIVKTVLSKADTGAGILLVKLDTRRIHDWDTFHTIFADVFGFSDFMAAIWTLGSTA